MPPEMTPQHIGVDFNHITQCSYCKGNATHRWYHPEEVTDTYTCAEHYDFVRGSLKPITDAWWARQYAIEARRTPEYATTV